MSCKIQITVDEQLSEEIKARAKQMGLSVSSYARLVLMSILPKNRNKLLDQALSDVSSGNTETMTITEFQKQIDHL